jgi:hypothetical protein
VHGCGCGSVYVTGREGGRKGGREAEREGVMGRETETEGQRGRGKEKSITRCGGAAQSEWCRGMYCYNQ